MFKNRELGCVQVNNNYNEVKENYMEIKVFEGVEFRTDGMYWSKRKKCWLSGFDINGYCRVKMNGKLVLVHRIIATLFIPNDNPEFTFVDHINRDRSDNRVENLRWVSNRMNSNNRSDQSSYGVGIYFYEGKQKHFQVQITINGKREYFGYHKTVEEAKAKRNAVYIENGWDIPD